MRVWLHPRELEEDWRNLCVVTSCDDNTRTITAGQAAAHIYAAHTRADSTITICLLNQDLGG